MKRDVKDLLKMAKLVLGKETYNKLKKIKDPNEAEHVIKYSLISTLEKKYHRLEKQMKIMEKRSENTLIVRSKILLIPSKIKHFSIDFDEKEFYKLLNLLIEVKKGMENV